MKFLIYCPCGVPVTRDLVESAIDDCCAHAIEAHGMKLTREQALEMVAIIGTDPGPPGPPIPAEDAEAGP
ncbi:MAG: hypothetical protein ACRDHF_00125 [Tepidiformaceae bacterium]